LGALTPQEQYTVFCTIGPCLDADWTNCRAVNGTVTPSFRSNPVFFYGDGVIVIARCAVIQSAGAEFSSLPPPIWHRAVIALVSTSVLVIGVITGSPGNIPKEQSESMEDCRYRSSDNPGVEPTNRGFCGISDQTLTKGPATGTDADKR
jgi:hypothetical protein